MEIFRDLPKNTINDLKLTPQIGLTCCSLYFLIKYLCISLITILEYKEGNNRPSSVNQTPLVHNHDKAGNKYHTQDNTNTRENPSVKIGAAEE